MFKRCVKDGNDNVFYVFFINDEVNEFNLYMIKKMCEDILEVLVMDFEWDKISGKMYLWDVLFVCCKSDGMLSLLMVFVNVKVMLICNICVVDGFVNGVIGIIVKKVKNINNDVKVIDIIFDNENVGKNIG